MNQKDQIINTQPVARCPVCGGEGATRYTDLEDRLFHVPGRWRMVQCTNASCAMFWLNPAPCPEDLAKCYQQYHTHAQTAEDHASVRVGLYARWREAVWSVQYPAENDQPDWRQRLKAMLIRCIYPVRLQLAYDRMYLQPIRGGRLLDVGCGDGTMMRNLQRLGWRVQGLEPDPAAVKAARHAGLNVQQGTIDTITLEQNAFDAVIMTHVIEHVSDPKFVLEACRHVLRPGGQLVVVTPNHESWCHRLFGRHWRGLEPPRHLQVLNGSAMRRILLDAGLTSVRVRTSSRDASGMYAASWAMRTRGHHEHGRRPPPMVRCCGDLLLALESIAVALGMRVGEELIATAEKPG